MGMFRKVVVVTILGWLFYLSFGWLVFDALLGTYTDKNTTQLIGFKKTPEEFSFPLLALSCLAYAALMVFILLYLTRTTSWVKGCTTGAITGLLVAVMANCYWLASSNFYNNVWVAVADAGAAGLTVGALGGVVVWLGNKISG
jgi:hypothetical protein